MKLFSDYDDKLEKNLSLIFGAVGILAIAINLFLKGFEMLNILDAVKDIVGLAVVIGVFLIMSFKKNSDKSFKDIGKDALRKLSSEYPQILMGPRLNRDKSEDTEENSSKALEYLFVMKNDPKSKKRAKLIPVDYLEDGELYIYVQKGTVAHGLHYGEGKVADEDIKTIQNSVKEKVNAYVENNYRGFFIISEEEMKKDKNLVLAIDFDENKLGKKKYYNAIYNCAKIAVESLLKYRK
ncbi:MAG: hypothetical protein KF816_06230 [Melioribacteraceae bacterium]|nr:hypothetical protein [Melioribacteraceae bacterium]